MLTLLKSRNQIVKEIHNEIDTAQERLLQQARDIIQYRQPLLNKKAERMYAVGFINTIPVVEHIKSKSIIVKNEGEANLIEYYKQKYPFQKFITEPELERICKKYNLVYKPVENYCKDVPESNLLEIEKAKKRDSEDAPEDKFWCELKRDNSFFLVEGSGGNWCGIWGSEWYRIPKKIEGHHFGNYRDANEYLRENLNFDAFYLIKKITNCTQNRQGLFICAPKSHFKGEDKSILRQIVEPKDPVVFRFVKGGVQVLSKWGLEGNDAALVNEKFN